jgi:hypothetical protein
MSRFGILMVVVALSAGLAAQSSGVQAQDDSDSKSSKTVAPVPWLDPSLATSPERDKMLAISVATVRDCSAGSSAICYGLCAPSSDHANREQPASHKSAPIKLQNATRSEPTTPVLRAEY